MRRQRRSDQSPEDPERHNDEADEECLRARELTQRLPPRELPLRRHPDRDGAAYEQSSLLGDAAKLSRPLLIIHGLADDNVVAAHSLRLSALLLAAGRPHSVLPLSGVTHMTPQEEVAENLLLLQVDFLRRALAR